MVAEQNALIAVDAFEARMNEIVPIPDTGSAEKDFIEQFKSAIDFYKSPGRPHHLSIYRGRSE